MSFAVRNGVNLTRGLSTWLLIPIVTPYTFALLHCLTHLNHTPATHVHTYVHTYGNANGPSFVIVTFWAESCRILDQLSCIVVWGRFWTKLLHFGQFNDTRS